MEEPKKPYSLKRKELIDNITDTINNSGVDIYTVINILDSMLKECIATGERLFNEEKATYEEELQKYQESLKA